MYEAPPRGLRRRAAGRAARLCRGGVVEIFSREPAPTTHQDEKQKRPPFSRSGKRCIATPKLGRGTPPKTNLAMRQPDFNGVDVDMDNGEATSEILEETVHGGQANMAFLHSDHDQAAKSNLDRERASMMKEHAATIAHERYDTFY